MVAAGAVGVEFGLDSLAALQARKRDVDASERRDRIAVNRCVVADERQTFDECLGDQETIDGIPMDRGQPYRRLGVSGGERELDEIMAIQQGHEIELPEVELSGCALEGELPD